MIFQFIFLFIIPHLLSLFAILSRDDCVSEAKLIFHGNDIVLWTGEWTEKTEKKYTSDVKQRKKVMKTFYLLRTAFFWLILQKNFFSLFSGLFYLDFREKPSLEGFSLVGDGASSESAQILIMYW